MAQYDAIAAQYAQWCNPTKRYATMPTIMEQVGDIEGLDVLDLACGSGFFTKLWARLGAQVTGVDISSEIIDKALEDEAKDPLGITYVCADACNTELGKFDLVTAIYLLNYARDEGELERMCNSLRRHVKEDGKVVAFTTHPNIFPQNEVKYERRFYSPDGKDVFENGDTIKCDIFKPGDEYLASFECTFWDAETYERILRSVGFSEVSWFFNEISQEGREAYDPVFWEDYQRVQSVAGLLCKP